jgi:hypothetical protein
MGSNCRGTQYAIVYIVSRDKEEPGIDKVNINAIAFYCFKQSIAETRDLLRVHCLSCLHRIHAGLPNVIPYFSLLGVAGITENIGDK